MALLALFVFGAVILGAGAMLSPAWPTPQPRIALAGTLALALIVGGTVFYASLIEWDTLVVDYLLFALVVGIFLGGTLSVGQSRAEKKGEILEDADQGWPGPQDLSVLGFIAVLLGAFVFIFPLPGEHAQVTGYLALAVREGDTLNTLAPFYPEIAHLYAPGFSALTAYLSQQLALPMPTIQFSVGAILALLSVWLAYDFGAELRNKRLGRAMALAMLGSLGIIGMLLEGQFMGLLGLPFLLAFVIYAYRHLRYGYPVDAIAAGLMLGATLISDPTMTVLAVIGFVPWLATMWLGQPRPTSRTWGTLAVGAFVVMLLSTLPWLLDIRPLLDSGITSPYTRSIDHLSLMLTYHGVWIVPIAMIGAWVGWQQRETVVILAVGWLLLIIDFSTTGGIARLFPFLSQYINPRDIAWFGPIIPYTLLGGVGLLWLWEDVIAPRTGSLSYRQTYALSVVAIALIIGVVVAFPDQAADMRDNPALAADEIAVLDWIRENTPPDARIMNRHETGWTAVITERNTATLPELAYVQVKEIEPLREADADYVITTEPLPERELVFQSGDVRVYGGVMQEDS